MAEVVRITWPRVLIECSSFSSFRWRRVTDRAKPLAGREGAARGLTPRSRPPARNAPKRRPGRREITSFCFLIRRLGGLPRQGTSWWVTLFPGRACPRLRSTLHVPAVEVRRTLSGPRGGRTGSAPLLPKRVIPGHPEAGCFSVHLAAARAELGTERGAGAVPRGQFSWLELDQGGAGRHRRRCWKADQAELRCTNILRSGGGAAGAALPWSPSASLWPSTSCVSITRSPWVFFRTSCFSPVR